MGLRIAFTISGAVSLGSYEGGALAALVAGLQPICTGDDPPVCVDVIGGASAGSVCALLAAWCLRSGLDPVRVFREVWVERADIGNLRRGAKDAPLNEAALEEIALGVLTAPRGEGRPRQHVPIKLRMALTPLRGLQYRIRSLEPRGGTDRDGDSDGDAGAVAAATFVDWCDFEIGPGTDLEDLTAPSGPVEAALASAANAWAFPPRWLDRAAVTDEYESNGITNLPESGGLWFTDGGTVDNEPIGRTLEVVAEADSGAGADDSRLLLLVHPHPGSATPRDDWAWADRTEEPSWLTAALRALRIMTSQNVHDDLRHLEKVNTRLKWLDDLTATFGAALGGLDPEARQATGEALAAVLRGIEADRARLNPGPVARDGAQAGSGDDPAELLRAVVARIGGLRGKREVSVEVISPRLVDPATPVEGLLGGEILIRFGGFLDRDLRLNDFRLGYASSMAWLHDGGLERHGVPAATAAAVARAAEAALPEEDHVGPDEFRRVGATTVRDLPVAAKYQLGRVLAHMTRVVVGDLGDDD